MAARSPFGSPSFRLVAQGLVALHRLIREGKDDSPEAEAVRDALDAPLKALNALEKERAQWLSEDLYAVSDPPAETTRKEMDAEAQHLLYEAVEARQDRDWDRALTLLRRLQEHVAPALLSYLRGSIWREAGNPEVATEFYRHATESEPANANYLAIYLWALAQSDPDAASNLASEVLADDEKYAPVVVARAADIRFHQTKNASDAGSARIYRELIPLLEKTLARIETDVGATNPPSAYPMTAGLLGLCHERLGNVGAAVDAYSRGLHVNPENDGLLAARGVLSYGTSPRAITDFEQAAGLGSSLVWPYFFLAHHYLTTNQFDRCRVMCDTGLKIGGSDTVKSQLEEWRGIAQAQLGFSPELVRAAFEAAVRLDPSNDLAKRNQAAFEASFAMHRVTHRATWEKEPVAAVRQIGLAERRYSLVA